MKTTPHWLLLTLVGLSLNSCEFLGDDDGAKGGAGSATGGTTTSAPTGGSPTTGGATTGGGMTTIPAGAIDWSKASPTPATATTKFPFPQNRASASCSYPAVAINQDVQALYAHWKTAFVTATGANGALRVQRDMLDGHPNDTVSEGIGYGMIISAYMDDQATFDKLWLYEQTVLDGNGLMHWNIDPNGQVKQHNSASDGDEDMAWGLILADKQWGGKGSLDDTYLNIAKGLIGKIWQFDVDHGRGDALKGGDGWNEDKVNPSYFAPAYYRVFQTVTGDANWAKVVESSYTILAKVTAGANAANGLVPDWCTTGGSPQGTYKYDACRTPFRVALDACYFDEPRAKGYLAKISQFFGNIGVSAMRDAYNLDGTVGTGAGGASPPFVGPAAVGAMGTSGNQKLENDGYSRIVAVGRNEARYYNSSWAVMSALMLSGNFLNYAAEP